MKHLLILFIALILPLTVHTQLFTYGPQVGLDVNTLSVSKNSYYTVQGPKVGYKFGAFVRKEFINTFFLIGEIDHRRALGGNFDDSTSFKFTDIAPSVLFGKNFGSDFNVRIFLGIVGSFPIPNWEKIDKIKESLGGGGDLFPGIICLDYKFGISVDISKIILNFSYENKLAGYMFSQQISSSEFIDWTMQHICLTVGYKIN